MSGESFKRFEHAGWEAIREAVRSEVRTHRDGDDFALPMPAVQLAGEKPGTSRGNA